MLVKRSDKRAYYKIGDKFVRMTGFTDMSTSKNPKEYSRQYVDEVFERSDVVGYSPSMSYDFDMHTENAVHEDIAAISDREMLGSDAVRTIAIVDLTSSVADGFACMIRNFSVIPDSEGGSTDAYTYSGNFKAAGERKTGAMRISEDGSEGDFLNVISSLDFNMTAAEFAAFKQNGVTDGGSYNMAGLVQGQISGNKCLKMSGITSQDHRIKFTRLFGDGFTAADIGRSFVMHCRIFVDKADNINGATIKIGMFGAKYTEYATMPYYVVEQSVSAGSWVNLKLPVTVTQTMVNSGVTMFGISQRYGLYSPTLYIDDIAVEEIQTAPMPIAFAMLLDDNNFSGAIENPIEYFADEIENGVIMPSEIEIDTNEEIEVTEDE